MIRGYLKSILEIYKRGDAREIYFDGIEPETNEYMIGGYQVCEKWLKSRKGRFLTTDEIIHYCRIPTVLSHTIEIQTEIDILYPVVEKDLIEFKEGI